MVLENIRELESKARTVFTELGYSKHSRRAKLIVARTIIRLHEEKGETVLDPGIVADFVNLQEMRYQNEELGRGTFLARKTAAEYLVQIYNTGTVICKRRKLLPPLSDCFEGILADILADKEHNPKANKRQYEQISTFFRWLEEQGHNDLSLVGEHIARKYLTDCSGRVSPASLDNKRRALRELFLSVSENGVLSEQMNRLFMFSIPVPKKIKPFMHQNEIAAVLDTIDRNTVRGKRDYAIILLAATTGLRACDIVALTTDAIDWAVGEIRIIQEKTEVALALPLTTGVGKAIRDYVLNARPKSKLNNIFLLARAPFEAMNRATLNSNLKNYRIKAGLPANRSFHSLRRSIATSMVTSGVSVITASQALGHRSINSTKQYISLDSPHLKECALDFSGIPVGGDVQ